MSQSEPNSQDPAAAEANPFGDPAAPSGEFPAEEPQFGGWPEQEGFQAGPGGFPEAANESTSPGATTADPTTTDPNAADPHAAFASSPTTTPSSEPEEWDETALTARDYLIASGAIFSTVLLLAIIVYLSAADGLAALTSFGPAIIYVPLCLMSLLFWGLALLYRSRQIGFHWYFANPSLGPVLSGLLLIYGLYALVDGLFLS